MKKQNGIRKKPKKTKSNTKSKLIKKGGDNEYTINRIRNNGVVGSDGETKQYNQCFWISILQGMGLEVNIKNLKLIKNFAKIPANPIPKDMPSNKDSYEEPRYGNSYILNNNNDFFDTHNQEHSNGLKNLSYKLLMVPEFNKFKEQFINTNLCNNYHIILLNDEFLSVEKNKKDIKETPNSIIIINTGLIHFELVTSISNNRSEIYNINNKRTDECKKNIDSQTTDKPSYYSSTKGNIKEVSDKIEAKINKILREIDILNQGGQKENRSKKIKELHKLLGFEEEPEIITNIPTDAKETEEAGELAAKAAAEKKAAEKAAAIKKITKAADEEINKNTKKINDLKTKTMKQGELDELYKTTNKRIEELIKEISASLRLSSST